ncbi:hypothetical protein [Rhodococcus sp. NPDC127528]|uniref:hypothetical protein n=1 Tax=unclassified Rhodococcus (in: high G+C Gram-positive bacteria) TaxID=192944 RepID=UPI00362879B2
MTPRQMRLAHLSACTLADNAYDDIERHGDGPVTRDMFWSVFAAFPPATWGEGERWRRQVARSFDDLAEDIDDGRQPLPTCTAEEMALHLILRRARALHLDGELDDQIAPIPEHPQDTQWDGPLDSLFEDRDVLLLFDEQPPGDGVNLEPLHWFDPFIADRGRDPDRGFRR